MGLRVHVSLLLEHGHVNAHFYPLGMLFDEASIVETRHARRYTTEASLTQSAMGATQSKKGLQSFKKTMRAMEMDIKARRVDQYEVAYEDDPWLNEGGGEIDTSMIVLPKPGSTS